MSKTIIFASIRVAIAVVAVSTLFVSPVSHADTGACADLFARARQWAQEADSTDVVVTRIDSQGVVSRTDSVEMTYHPAVVPQAVIPGSPRTYDWVGVRTPIYYSSRLDSAKHPFNPEAADELDLRLSEHTENGSPRIDMWFIPKGGTQQGSPFSQATPSCTGNSAYSHPADDGSTVNLNFYFLPCPNKETGPCHFRRTGSTESTLDLSGTWNVTGYTTSDGPAGTEVITIAQNGSSIVATKVVGDENVPAGQITFKGTITGNTSHVQIQGAYPGFTNPDFSDATLTIIDANDLTVTSGIDDLSLTRAGP
jgi:hypothetical protein